MGCPAYLRERNQTAAINVGDDRGLPGVRRRLDFCRWR